MTRVRRDANAKPSQVQPQGIDGVGDLVTDVGQDLIDRTAPDTVIIRDVVDRWEHLKIEFHCHVWGRSIKGGAEDFCAVFQSSADEPFGNEVTAGGQVRRRDIPVDGGAGHADNTVFISIVEVLKEQEGGDIRRMPAIVRLQPLDGCSNRRFLAKDTQFGERTSEVLWPLTYGEGQRLEIRRRLRPTSCGRKPKDRVIKGRPQILETIPDNQTPTVERRFLLNPEIGRMARSISVSLEGETIGFSLAIGNHFVLDGVEMLVRPLELQISTVKEVNHALYSHHEQEPSAQTEDPEGRAIPSMDAP